MYKVWVNDAHLWIEPQIPGHELVLLKTIGGLMDLVDTVIGPFGTRFGVYHKKDICIINDGTSQFHTRSGSLGFVGHENYDKNINLLEAEALSRLPGEDIKEIRKNLLRQWKNKPMVMRKEIKQDERVKRKPIIWKNK